MALWSHNVDEIVFVPYLYVYCCSTRKACICFIEQCMGAVSSGAPSGKPAGRPVSTKASSFCVNTVVCYNFAKISNIFHISEI